MYAFRIALLAGIAATAILVIHEAVAWNRRGSSLSRRQMIIRVTSGILLICLLGLLFSGSILGVFGFLNPHEKVKNPVRVITFLSLYVGLGCALVVLALLDIREILKNYQRELRDARRDLGEKGGRKQ
jgi:hypothetical protein